MGFELFRAEPGVSLYVHGDVPREGDGRDVIAFNLGLRGRCRVFLQDS